MIDSSGKVSKLNEVYKIFTALAQLQRLLLLLPDRFPNADKQQFLCALQVQSPEELHSIYLTRADIKNKTKPNSFLVINKK